jgi:hypothetical protein
MTTPPRRPSPAADGDPHPADDRGAGPGRPRGPVRVPRRRPPLDEPPRHPTGQAAVLLVVVTLVIVALAALSAWGLI